MPEHTQQYLPWAVAAAAILVVAAAMKGKSGPTVLVANTDPNASAAIVQANEAANQDYVQLHLGLAKTAADAATSLANANAAVRVAQIQGATSAELQDIQSQAQEAVNANQTAAQIQIAGIGADQAKAIASLQEQGVVAMSQSQAEAAIAVSRNNMQAETNAANAQAEAQKQVADAQSRSSIWGSIVSGVKSVVPFSSNLTNYAGVASGSADNPNNGISGVLDTGNNLAGTGALS